MDGLKGNIEGNDKLNSFAKVFPKFIILEFVRNHLRIHVLPKMNREGISGWAPNISSLMQFFSLFEGRGPKRARQNNFFFFGITCILR
jgi:hypothetical protein